VSEKLDIIATEARLLAKDILSGRVIPGRNEYFDHFGLPCCTLGYLANRVVMDPEELEEHLTNMGANAHARTISADNDFSGDNPERRVILARDLERLAETIDKVRKK
jgi:hypothetical protein